MRFGMLVVDLDGTAVRRDGTVTARDLAAVRALRAAGVVVTVATGRVFSGTVAVAQVLGVDGTVACANGSELVDVRSAQVRSATYVERGHRMLVRDVFASHGLGAAVLTTHELHHDGRAASHTTLLRAWTHRLVEHVEIATDVWHERQAAALVGVGSDEAGARASAEIRAAAPALETLFVRDYDGQGSFVKVRRAEVDKGTALASMARERGMDPAGVVAVGDWHNDTPMLRVAGLSFAMRDAPDEVRGASDETLRAERGAGDAIAEIADRVWGLAV